MYQQVIEAVAVFASHGNSGGSAPWEINLVQKLCDCVEIEIGPDNWIMAVDANNTNLLLLGVYYNIQWEECSCLKGIRLEDVTKELEDKAYEEMRHNIPKRRK